MRLTLAALLAAVPAALTAQARTQLEVTLPVPAAQARARVQSAFAGDGLSIESATGDVIAGAYNETPYVRATIRAAVIAADSASSRVVFTGVLNTPQAGMLPAETIPVSEKNRRQGKPGERAWHRMERLRDALAK